MEAKVKVENLGNSDYMVTFGGEVVGYVICNKKPKKAKSSYTLKPTYKDQRVADILLNDLYEKEIPIWNVLLLKINSELDKVLGGVL